MKMLRNRNSPEKLKIRKGGGFGCLCCNYRPSVSSPVDHEDSSGGQSQEHGKISLLAHAMVQERLDQIIREAQREGRRNRRMASGAKFILMVAVEVESNDPVKDFGVSMAEIITSNAIEHPKDLRRLLNLYLALNSELAAGAILQVFYEVCAYMFLG